MLTTVILSATVLLGTLAFFIFVFIDHSKFLIAHRNEFMASYQRDANDNEMTTTPLIQRRRFESTRSYQMRLTRKKNEETLNEIDKTLRENERILAENRRMIADLAENRRMVADLAQRIPD